MRMFINIVAAFLLTCGLIWFFQGMHILPGRFLGADSSWSERGGLVALGGIALFAINSMFGKKY